MGKSKKTFINRKNAVTFHLVHRSQHDPLVADENAPQRVLLEAKEKEQPTTTSVNSQTPSTTDPTKRKEQLKKFGVFFDDDYDYLQHLKEHGKDKIIWEYVESPNQKKKNRPKIQLPSSVFESEFEEEEGMLNKAAPRPGPRPDWDPDVVAALDEDFDFDNPENELEDDFVAKAMDGNDEDDEDFHESDEDYEEDGEDEASDVSSDNLMVSDDDDENENEMMDRLAPLLRNKRFADEETKSRFTEYSMSSSVIERNEHLQFLDERFEKFYATYDEPDIGPLDLEEFEGNIGQKHPLMRQLIAESRKKNDYEPYKKEWDENRIDKYREIHNESDEEMVKIEIDDDKQKKWDCESILSTYSNIYNHPKLIEEPKRKRRSQKIELDPKTGIPMYVLKGSDTNKLTVKSLAKFDNENSVSTNVGNSGPKSLCAKSVLSTLSVLSIRPKDETPDEKKERKKLLKEYRMERRIERKANSEAFKEEKKKQTNIKINNQNNIQGNRIL